MSQTAGVYLLQPGHAPAIQALAADPAIAAYTRIPHPYPENGAAEFIASQIAEREAGRSFGFAIEDRGELVGVCGLEDAGRADARELGFWVGRPYWGRGYASLAVKMLLQFAFRNLGLAEVSAHAFESNVASRRVLEKNGFRLVRVERGEGPALKRPDEPLCVYAITAARWRVELDAPVLGRLHPGLRALLQAELAAGNEIAESAAGWPEPDGLFVRLKHPFRVAHAGLPAGIRYARIDDPHWWEAEYSTESPRHILAC